MPLPALITQLIILTTTASSGHKKKKPKNAFYALLDPEHTNPNKIEIDNDEITHLFLDNHLKSLNGIKSWPIYLESLWIGNMQNFSISSLKRIPDRLTALTLSRNDFKAHSSDEMIKLPRKLEYLYIQLCEAAHETIAALDMESLSHLVELHLIYLDKTRYSEQYPIIFPRNLEYLEISYALLEKILKHQKGQDMHRLRYVLVHKNKGEHIPEDTIRSFERHVQTYFNAHNLTMDLSDWFVYNHYDFSQFK